MFKISANQLTNFDEQAERKFCESIREHLETRHPGFLPRFPIKIREFIVANLIARSRLAGATWQSSIALLSDLMELFAPNLTEDKTVREIIGEHGPDTNQRIRTISAEMTDQDWKRVISKRSDLGLYTPHTKDDSDMVERVATALPLVLWDHVDLANSLDVASTAIDVTNALGFEGTDDAPLAVAAWRFFYGKNFATSSDSWVSDVRNENEPPRLRLEMLRTRIMLDHGRRV